MSIETICAVCRLSDGLVLNTIVASPDDTPPDECQLIEIKEGVFCNIGLFWNGIEFQTPSI